MTGFTDFPPDLVEELAGLVAECIVDRREEGDEVKHDMLSEKWNEAICSSRVFDGDIYGGRAVWIIICHAMTTPVDNNVLCFSCIMIFLLMTGRGDDDDDDVYPSASWFTSVDCFDEVLNSHFLNRCIRLS